MKSRFRDYRQRLVANIRPVSNADPYRNERGRFSTALEATRTAVETPTPVPGNHRHLIDLARAAEGMSHTHHEAARSHLHLSNFYTNRGNQVRTGNVSRSEYLRLASLHRVAANRHREAADRINSYAPAPNPGGFSHLDRTDRLVWADWLEDHGHAELAHHMRVYSS
jgi:hypothetical protein